MNEEEAANMVNCSTVHLDSLTFVLVGAGPTGVEMAGAIATLIRNTLSTEFRRVDPNLRGS